MKAILTVIGQDKPGIIAEVSAMLAARTINIEDISQTILQGNFTMIMLVDISRCPLPLSELVAEAQALGWSGGSLEPYAPGRCIGGGRFGNYEGLLPEKEGRVYTECDIDTLGADSRGAKRIVFSNDGLIYYTADHYQTFELLYGEE